MTKKEVVPKSEFFRVLNQLKTAQDAEEIESLSEQLIYLLDTLPDSYQEHVAKALVSNNLPLGTVNELILTIYNLELAVTHESLISSLELYLDHSQPILVIAATQCIAHCCPNGILRILDILASPQRPQHANLVEALLWLLVF